MKEETPGSYPTPGASIFRQVAQVDLSREATPEVYLTVLKRELNHSVRGRVANQDEDWWRLVFDTDVKRLYVEHEWKHEDVSWRGKANVGTEDIELADYLSESSEGPGKHELMRIFSSLFEGHPPD